MAKAKGKATDPYILNIPVYISERHPVGSMFGLTEEQLIEGVSLKINQYNEEKDFKVLNKKNKLPKRQIGHIDYETCKIGDRDALLLTASAYTINKQGEHIKGDSVVSVEPDDKVGDKSNQYMLVPIIDGLDKKHYNWILLVYDGPSRDSEEIIVIAKVIMNDIIQQKIKNIKLPTLLEELKGTFPKIRLQLNAVEHLDNSHFDKFKKYETHYTSFTKQEIEYVGMPFEEVNELVKEKFGAEFKRKLLKIISGNKQYKITQEIDNFKADNDLLVERYFNFEEVIPATQVDGVLSKEFIITVAKKVLAQYFTNGEY